MNTIKSKILCFLVGVILYSEHGTTAFSTNHPLSLSPRLQHRQASTTTTCNNWLGDLWEEVIEFSTYGPSERKVLKARREEAAAAATKKAGGDISLDSFQRAQQNFGSKRNDDNESASASASASSSSSPSLSENDSLSLQSFQAAIASSEKEDIDFDGYKLRDLLVEKWGVPLDIDFQRGYGGSTVYCTILPVAFGSSRCRHRSELDYLMHLQGVVEVLQKYDNLDPFIFFVQTTKKTPKPGVESAPYLMQLDDDALKKILAV